MTEREVLIEVRLAVREAAIKADWAVGLLDYEPKGREMGNIRDQLEELERKVDAIDTK